MYSREVRQKGRWQSHLPAMQDKSQRLPAEEEVVEVIKNSFRLVSCLAPQRIRSCGALFCPIF